ncbi:HAMP domain-containing sensor histidine kinase [Archangium sp.]|uniref:sensor histidine kinase n=1 Tax=Archangium sp. TaxID=1872627 RepID=UPI002869F491|nr:HAMP domain-containing sensor histidine kinase [Archangium sp.]
MSFVEDLKDYLLRLHQAENTAASGRPLVTLDPDWVRAELIQLFERLEREPPSSKPQRFARLSLEGEFEVWTKDDRVIHFANKLADLLQGSFLRGARREEVEQYIRLAMALWLGLPESVPSQARKLELERLSNIAWHTPVPKSSFRGDGWSSLSAYALEIRAVRRTSNHVERTPIGNVLLSLTGRDALHWLLHVEAAQSTGPSDDWRLSRETAIDLLAHPEEVHSHDAWEDENFDFPHSWVTLRRLQALGLLKVISEADWSGYKLLSEGTRALEALVSPNGSPFSVLADTLSQDEALAALDDKTSHSLAEASLNTSAIATARQARLVVHEIRNALIPAQFALNSFYGSLVGSEIESTVARFRPRIDSGIERVLKFVNDLLKTSELATRPPEAFDLKRAVLDAKASLSTGLEILVTGPDELPTVLGYRERFVLAVVNLLRNAEQVGASHVEVDIQPEDDGQNILLTVDDNGPGVPVENRDRVFQRGVSFRPGGAGEGLALVREVVEFELRGKVACVDKSGGGARFRMRLPVMERSPR